MPFLALSMEIAVLLFSVCKSSCFKLWESVVQCAEQCWSMAPALLWILYFFFTLQERCVQFHASISLERKQVILHSAGGSLGRVTCWLCAVKIWKPHGILLPLSCWDAHLSHILMEAWCLYPQPLRVLLPPQTCWNSSPVPCHCRWCPHDSAGTALQLSLSSAHLVTPAPWKCHISHGPFLRQIHVSFILTGLKMSIGTKLIWVMLPDKVPQPPSSWQVLTWAYFITGACPEVFVSKN